MEENALLVPMTEEMPQATDDAAVLRRLMDGESVAVAYYRRLACRSGRNSASQFRQIASDEEQHLRQLQTEYYLLTGDSYNPTKAEPVDQGLLSALRTAYQAEQSDYQAYMRAAESTASTALAALYVDHAADEARHAQQLRRMVERVMG